MLPGQVQPSREVSRPVSFRRHSCLSSSHLAQKFEISNVDGWVLRWAVVRLKVLRISTSPTPTSKPPEQALLPFFVRRKRRDSTTIKLESPAYRLPRSLTGAC